MLRLLNAKVKPMVFYGLHMASGIAEYKEQNLVVFINDDVINGMAHTFLGCPVYVNHVNDVDMENIRETADGYVVETFFNKADGKHWCKFVVVTDQAMEAIIMKKWKLSNAYAVKRSKGGGKWHGADYQQEVLEGEYEHLAIVPNPRYAESIILTPEEFKVYNAEKEAELFKLANSVKETSEEPEGDEGMNFFTKQKVENSSLDLKNTLVVLTKSKKEKSLEQLINEADEVAMNEGKPQYADVKHLVKIGDKEMTVNELVESYSSMVKKNQEDEEAKKNAEKEAADKAAAEKENSDKGDDELENEDEDLENEDEDEEKKDKKQNSAGKKDQKHFNAIKEAAKKAAAEKLANEDRVLELDSDRVQRGKSRYGSKK